MTKTKFEIGNEEKHNFVVDWDWITKRIKIEQDGETVADEMHYSQRGKKFQFDIGSSERHHVEITIGLTHPVELLVDGRPAPKTKLA